jgi:ATP-dependent helicase HepA
MQLHADRFLPPTPLHVHLEGEELQELLGQARKKAEAQAPAAVEQARREMTTQLKREIARLRDLKKVNPSVRQEEIDLLVQQWKALEEHLSNARPRLDALQVHGPLL